MSDTTNSISISDAARSYAGDIFRNRSENYVYHNLSHTRSVVKKVSALSAAHGLDERKRELMEVAAWFHDIAYGDGTNGQDGHEERGAAIAREFLIGMDVAEEDIRFVYEGTGNGHPLLLTPG